MNRPNQVIGLGISQYSFTPTDVQQQQREHKTGAPAQWCASSVVRQPGGVPAGRYALLARIRLARRGKKDATAGTSLASSPFEHTHLKC